MKKYLFLILFALFFLNCKTVQAEEIDNQQVLLNEIGKAPIHLIEKFCEDGWQISLTDENLSQKYFNGVYEHVLAVTDSTNKAIFVENNKESIERSTLHELGHFVEYVEQRPDQSELFFDIYTQERNLFVSQEGNTTYARLSPVEYFAEAFQEIILHPYEVYETTPQTFAFVGYYVVKYQQENQ